MDSMIHGVILSRPGPIPEEIVAPKQVWHIHLILSDLVKPVHSPDLSILRNSGGTA